MQKSTLYGLLFVFTLFLFTACNPAEKRQQQLKDVYKMAQKNGDIIVATQAIYELITLDSAANVAWKDTLFKIYLNRQMLYPAQRLANEIYSRNPKDTLALQIVAQEKHLLGKWQESQALYEKLLPLRKNPSILYYVAANNYNLNKKNEAYAQIKDIFNDKSSQYFSVIAGQQTVPVLAAAINFEGVLLFETGKIDEAKKDFDLALKIAPNFQQAQNNLANANKPAAAPKQ